MTLFEVKSYEERYLLEKEDTTTEQFKEDCLAAGKVCYNVYPMSPWADAFEVVEWLCENLGYKKVEALEENKLFCPKDLSIEKVKKEDSFLFDDENCDVAAGTFERTYVEKSGK